MRLRRSRETKALAFLQKRKLASAFEIGAAAVQGELRAHKMSNQAKEGIGLSIAVELVRRRIARPTASNRFRILDSTEWLQKADTNI